MKSILSKINPFKKSQKRLNAEYMAMRRGEKTTLNIIASYIAKEYKWLAWLVVAIIGITIAILKL